MSMKVVCADVSIALKTFPDASFDAATIGFGIRNVSDVGRALTELHRVLGPGGRLAILEITQLKGARAACAGFWLDRVVPLVSRVLSGGRAYVYLPASVKRFLSPQELARALSDAGFAEIRYRFFGAGSVTLHVGVKR